MKRATLAALLSLSASGAAFAQTAPTPLITGMDARAFVAEAAGALMLDLAAAREVERKIADPAVKAYAQQILADDGGLEDALKPLARQAGAALPDKLEGERALVLKDLQSSDGAQLEQKYRASQIGQTRQAIEILHNFAAGGGDPGLKTWAATTLPTLQKHLDAATRLPQIPSAPQG